MYILQATSNIDYIIYIFMVLFIELWSSKYPDFCSSDTRYTVCINRAYSSENPS